MNEIRIQSEFFKYIWNTYPQTRRLLFHVPNGGKRDIREAGQLKASGVIAGIPDILFIWRGKLYALEFKDAGGRLSEHQVQVHFIWLDHDVKVKTVYDSDNAIKYIESIILDK